MASQIPKESKINIIRIINFIIVKLEETKRFIQKALRLIIMNELEQVVNILHITTFNLNDIGTGSLHN